MINNDYEKIHMSNPDIQIEAFENREAQVSTKLRWHEQIEIKLILSGSIEVYCDTKSYTLCGQDVFIVNPCEVHATRAAQGNSRYHMIVIDPAVLYTAGYERYIDPFLSGEISITNLIRQDDRINQKILEIVDELSAKEQGYEMCVKGLMLQLFTLFFRNHSHKSSRISDAGHLKRLEPVLSYMMLNYNRNIDLDKMGSLCGISGKRLCTIFSLALGVSPVQYLTRIRMNKADVLLSTTSLSIGEIAEMTGYQDSLYFSRRYRKFCGCSPTEKRLRNIK